MTTSQIVFGCLRVAKTVIASATIGATQKTKYQKTNDFRVIAGVERCVRDAEVASSNLVTPISKNFCFPLILPGVFRFLTVRRNAVRIVTK